MEEDEKGEMANVLIVEEEEEDEGVEQGPEKKEIIEEAVKAEEAVKEEVATIQDVLDTLTLENKQENIDILPEEQKPSEVQKEESAKKEKVEEKVEKKVEMKETRSKRGKVADKENTPKIQKEAVAVKEGTPKNGTPVIKASKLGTPKLGTPKVSPPTTHKFSPSQRIIAEFLMISLLRLVNWASCTLMI